MRTKRLCFALFLLFFFLTLPLIATTQLKATLDGHTDVVWSVAFSPDGKILASGSWDQTVRLWDVETEQLLHTLTGHTNEVLSVAFSPEGGTLVSSDWDGNIRLWNPETGKLKKTLTEHRGGVGEVVFSPDGTMLASGSVDQTILLWNTSTWQVERILTGHTSVVDTVVFSIDGAMLASGSRDRTIRLWNPHTGKHTRTLTGHTHDVRRMVFSPDGGTLASGAPDGTVRLWNPHTGKLKRTLIGQDGPSPVAFSPDGETLAIGNEGGISLWDTNTEQYKVPLATGIGNAVSIVFSLDGQMVASGGADNLVRLWDFTLSDYEVPFVNSKFDIANIPEPQPPPMEIIQFFDLSPFYQQWINVAGFPVIASAKVNPYAVKEAAWVIWQMIGHRKSILKNLGQYRQRLSVLAIDESWGDLPEYEVLDDPLKFWGAPARDVVTSQVTLASEENLLDPDNYSFLIHEFTHQIHNGLRRVGSDFDNRLHATYDMAMKSGLWRGTYAASNHDEYLAEAVGSWFHAPYEANPIKTRAALKAYDLELAELITEIFGDFEWRYTSPATRTHLPHLKGFDPQQRLRSGGPYPWEIRASEIERQLKDPNSDGGGKWVNLKLYPPSQLQTLLKSKTTAARASFIMVNDTGRDISLYAVDANGTTHIRYRSTTRKIYDFNTHVGSIWLIKDHNGEDLAVFRAVERVGRVLVTPALDWMTPNAVEATGLNIPDPSLRAKIEEALGKGSGDTITAADMARLTHLDARNAHISDLTGLQHATNLTELLLGAEWVDAQGDWINSNPVSTLSPLAGLINLTALDLRGNDISDISPLAGLINLTRLSIEDNSVSDLLPLTGLTNLAELKLFGNSITDISPLSGLTNLTWLQLFANNITDLSPLAGLTNLTRLALARNGISDISALAGLTNLSTLGLAYNNLSDISPLANLTNLARLGLRHNGISDLSPLVANTGFGSGDRVDVRGNPRSYLSIYTHIPALQSRGVTVEFDPRTPTTLLKISGDNQKGVSQQTLANPFVVEVRDQVGLAFAGVPVTFISTAGGGTLSTTTTTTDENGRAETRLTLGFSQGTYTVDVSAEGVSEPVTFNAVVESIQFDLSVPSGASLIHVPLKVTAVDGVAKTIESISDLYDALGGVNAVNYLITYDSSTQTWLSYFSTADRNTAADRGLTDEMGILAGMKAEATIRLRGEPLGTAGSSAIALNQGLTLVGLPLKDSRISRVSDLLALEGIGGNVPVIILTDDGEFKAVGRAGDPGDIPITGGQGFILTAQQAAQVTISGEPWTTGAETALAPSTAQLGIEIGDTTPVLGIKGSVVNEVSGINQAGFRVVVKNLSNPIKVHSAAAAVNGDDGIGYRLTIVDIKTARAAQVDDVLEISAQSPNPFIGVKPLQYIVTAEDVLQSLIQLPELIAYEIPAETELLANYPNPFNPETWIPYRLAEDAFVTLTIYDGKGQVVRSVDVGHQVAGVYESRAKAVYWDGRNNLGETVASGVYFYHLKAGNYSQTRRLVILK